MDNHPTYDFAEGRTIRIGRLHYLALEDLLLNSALVVGAEVLAELATLLNKRDLAARFQTERKRRVTLVNEYMWDEEDCFG
jgi:neutral trehalase